MDRIAKKPVRDGIHPLAPGNHFVSLFKTHHHAWERSKGRCVLECVNEWGGICERNFHVGACFPTFVFRLFLRT